MTQISSMAPRVAERARLRDVALPGWRRWVPVVTAELLPYLGSERHVRLLVTVGSPLGIDDFWMLTTGRLQRAFPSIASSGIVTAGRAHAPT